MSQLIVRDARGANQTLYLGSESVLQSALSSYEMPPSIAELTGFDARYSSGRMVETYPAVMSNTTKYEYTVNIQSSAYPVTISLEGTKATLSGVKMAARTQQGQLLGSLSGAGSSVKITSPSVKSVILTLNDGANIPKVFALGQNYPNPFNPTTRIRFTVPSNGRAALRVYDVLGREIATLVDGELRSGVSQQAEFDASKLASGVYVARLEFMGKELTRKMILIK